MQAIYKKAHSQVLEARSVDYLIKSTEFEELWKVASLAERDILLCMGILEAPRVRIWMTSVRNTNIQLMRTVELKKLARSIRIYNYSRLTRDELVVKIWEHYERKHEN